jgi:hypothetical protein
MSGVPPYILQHLQLCIIPCEWKSVSCQAPIEFNKSPP